MNEDLTKAVENDRFARFLGMRLTHVEPGYAEAEMEITDSLMNGADGVHGGAIFSLADFAFAAAANAGEALTLGINANISFFKPSKGHLLTAKASKVSASRRLCNYNVDIFDGDVLIARMVAEGYTKR